MRWFIFSLIMILFSNIASCNPHKQINAVKQTNSQNSVYMKVGDKQLSQEYIYLTNTLVSGLLDSIRYEILINKPNSVDGSDFSGQELLIVPDNTSYEVVYHYSKGNGLAFTLRDTQKLYEWSFSCTEQDLNRWLISFELEYNKTNTDVDFEYWLKVYLIYNIYGRYIEFLRQEYISGLITPAVKFIDAVNDMEGYLGYDINPDCLDGLVVNKTIPGKQEYLEIEIKYKNLQYTVTDEGIPGLTR